jgi:hypothetical protein
VAHRKRRRCISRLNVAVAGLEARATRKLPQFIAAASQCGHHREQHGLTNFEFP